MGAKSRRKDKVGELEAAAEIRRVFRTQARRGRQYQGADESPDVLTAIPDVHFEVKRAETLRLYEALEQAVEDAGQRVPAVLSLTTHREVPSVTMPLGFVLLRFRLKLLAVFWLPERRLAAPL